MTREKAIETLKLLKPKMRFDNSGWLYTKQALDMAIQALSQEPTDEMVHVEILRQVMWERDIAIGQLKELGYDFGQKIEPCTDAVSREELLKAISTWDKFGVDDTNSLFRLDNLSLPHYVPYIHYDDVIKCIKGIPSVTQKSGKWIHFAQSDDCSLCGYSTGKYGSPSKFCPNCGARMESEDK